MPPMKRNLLPVLLATFLLVLSCQNKDAVPRQTGLSGTWLLVQNRFWNGRALVTETVPLVPIRLIAFTDAGTVATVGLPDTTLLQAHYYEAYYSDLIGPVLSLKKDKTSPATGSVKYLVDRDTLEISLLRSSYFSYRFRRL